MDRAVREGAARLARELSDVRAIGYFGSYARGDWGVGSDVDLVVVLASSRLPFERRAAHLGGTLAAGLPVAADLLVYTEEEWRQIRQQAGGQRLADEVVWVLKSEG